MNRRIVINADDFGLCEGVNKAVFQAHTEGVLTSATIMANMPDAVEAVGIARRLPALGIGVHLNLFEGQPISKDTSVKCLLDAQGRFAYSPFRLSLLSMVVHKIRKAIKTELAAQIQWVVDSGLKPTHLDSHKHIHSFPAIFPIVCDLARKFKIAAIRWTFEPNQACNTPWPVITEFGRERAGLIRTMARVNRLQNQGLLKTDALFGVAHTGKIDINFFKAVTLYNLVATAEVMTHPGLPDGLNADRTRLLHQRKVELDALCSRKTREYLKNAEIELVHYGEL